MNQPTDHSYYLARAEASRALAGRAANPAIAAIHVELATRYEMLAAQPDSQGGGRPVPIMAWAVHAAQPGGRH